MKERQGKNPRSKKRTKLASIPNERRGDLIPAPKIKLKPIETNLLKYQNSHKILSPMLSDEYTYLYFDTIPKDRKLRAVLITCCKRLQVDIGPFRKIDSQAILTGYRAFLVLNKKLTHCLAFFTFKPSASYDLIAMIRYNRHLDQDAQAKKTGIHNDKQSDILDDDEKSEQSDEERAEHLRFFKAAQGRLPNNKNQLQQLEFAWVDPDHRRKGILTALWPIFQQELGMVIDVQSPSVIMMEFIKKQASATVEYNSNILTV